MGTDPCEFRVSWKCRDCGAVGLNYPAASATAAGAAGEAAFLAHAALRPDCHHRRKGLGVELTAVLNAEGLSICPACGDPLLDHEDDRYKPFHVSCHFGD